MAAATCFYHPDQVSSTACSQCGVPLCKGCVQTVANRPVCQGCVGAIRARVASQMNATPPSASGVSTPIMQAPPASPARARVTTGAQTSDSSVGRLLLGILAATVVASIASIIWEKIYVTAHFGISLIYIGIGIAAAWALVKVSGRSGPMMTPLAMATTLFGLMVGHVMLTYDATGTVSMPAFTYVCSHLGPSHWICLAVGLFGAFRYVDRTM